MVNPAYLSTTPQKSVVIIVPTYNEKENIEKTISDLENFFLSTPSYQTSILVFDSASTDGTPTLIQQLQAQYQNIFLLTESQKTGLGSAYIQAMQYAMDTLKADIIFEFDADGSHQPKHIAGMLDLISNGADCVIGSRYIENGTIPKNWGVHRKFLSTVGNTVARFFLTRQYQDFTSGFRATKTEVLRKINLSQLLSKNYAYKLHLLWAIHKTRARILEFPIEFIDRKKGYSKFPRNNILESLKVVILLRWMEIKRKYAKIE